MKTVYEKFGLESGTQDFIGHAMALYLNDDWELFFSKYEISCNTLSVLVISLRLHDQPTTDSSFTLCQWLVMVNRPTSTLFLVSASFLRQLTDWAASMVVSTCWTNPLKPLSQMLMVNLWEWPAMVKLSRRSRWLAIQVTSYPEKTVARSESLKMAKLFGLSASSNTPYQERRIPTVVRSSSPRIR